MAHHNSTPKSVLEAPPSRPRWLVLYRFSNRHDRRHARTWTGGQRFIPRERQIPGGANVPYTKPNARIGS